MTPDERLRQIATKIADFAAVWYAGTPDGKDDFRFIAHIMGDISEAFTLGSAARQEQDAQIAAKLIENWKAAHDVEQGDFYGTDAYGICADELDAALRASAPKEP